MIIGLYGIHGVYNFGCEAIVRGAVKLIDKLYPDAQIIYYSYSYDYDSVALNDLYISIREVFPKKNMFMRLENKGKTLLNMDERVLFFDYKKIIDEVDMIFSIGGDIYTIPEAVRKVSIYPYYNQIIDFCNRVIDAGKQVVIYGASIGPFGEYKKAIDYYKKNLSRYKMIICREKETINYLKNIDINNVCFFPDPAFQVESPNDGESEKKYIAVNLSPLSVMEIYGTIDSHVYGKMAALLDQIYEKYQKELLFIPHVLSKDINDNDEQFLKQIQLLMKNKEYVKFADYSNGFLGIKEQLRECYITVSARMHCAINSVVENVPVILLSYSQKSIGMCKYIYHNKNWVIDLNKIEIELIPVIDEMWNRKEEISMYLEQRNVDIDADYQNGVGMLSTLI